MMSKKQIFGISLIVSIVLFAGVLYTAKVKNRPAGAFSTDTFQSSITGATNIGVGTSSPYGLLSIEQGTEAASFWVGNNGSSSPSFVINGVNGNGMVGIGTVPTTFALEVNGVIKTSLGLDLGNTGAATAQSLFAFGSDTYLQSRLGALIFRTGTSGNALLSLVNTNDQVGIGTTTVPTGSTFQVMNPSSPSATTTVDFGAQALTAKTCFNVRNNLGAATSFYFVGTTMVVEAKRCL